MGQISEMVRDAHENAVDRGFWEKPITIGDSLALMHSEVSEALEEHRNHKEPTETYYSGKLKMLVDPRTPDVDSITVTATTKDKSIVIPFGDDYIITTKPEGIPSEMADFVIRVFDFCGYYGIDLEAAIKEKMDHNSSRPYKHGNKKI